MRRCLCCFEEYADIYDICPNCGHSVGCLPDFADSLMPGTLLRNRYLIGKTAGRGGFGIVYRAFDNVLGQTVAIKELTSVSLSENDTDTDEQIPGSPRGNVYYRLCKRNFLNEARVGAELGMCPGICAVREYFEENSKPYMVMDYYSGVQLSQYIGTEECSTRFALYVATELCRIVENVHNRGKVHRDIAPDNIIICTDGEGIGIRLLDFGAARKEGEKTEKKDTVLKTGFSPPEQYFPGKASNRGDVYSIGASLYAMLCGACPEKLEESEKCLSLPAGPNETKIHKALRNAISCATNRDPQSRYKTVAELRLALEKAAKLLPDGLPESRIDLCAKPLYSAVTERENCDLTEKRGVSLPMPERLLPGTVLSGRYTIGLESERVGDCMIYEAKDTLLRSTVSLTEYFPRIHSTRDYDGVGVRQTGIDGFFRDRRALFYDAAQRLGGRSDTSGEERITDLFSENGTVYFVSDCTGMISLREYLSTVKRHRLREKEVKKMLSSVAGVLKKLYDAGYYHGNVSPDSIYTDGERTILRFPCMLYCPGIKLKPENRERFYSAPELGVEGNGYTYNSDIYSLAAVACLMLSGKDPSDSSERADLIVRAVFDPLKDQLWSLSVSDKMRDALSAAMSFRPEERKDFAEVLNSK